MPPKPAPLPAKEAALFKTLLSQYESRQLKKAIKTADQILRKVGDHGETIAMKGLVLTYQGKREEGLELVKKGVRLDLQSHICWHVYGLVHKQDKNYEEALKCYAQALKYDPINMNILRDAGTLQSQLRLFDSLQQTRLTILKLRMTLRQNWAALAVAYALNSNWVACQKLMEEFLRMVKDIPAHDPEYSELLLFNISVLERQEQYGEALKQLLDFTESNKIVDRMQVAIMHPRLLMKMGRKDEANEQYKALIDRNADCYDSYRLYFESINLPLDNVTEETMESTVKELQEFATKYPRALVPQRILLTITNGDQFKELVERYIHRGLKKNIPSLFVDLKPLYKDYSKRDTIQTIVEAFKCQLEEQNNPSKDDDLSPTTYVWTLYYLGLHYSALGDFQKAQELLDAALGHTPTLPELYMAKARNLKRAGDLVEAVTFMDAALELDGQDRFLNTKCATYHLRVGEIEEAQKIFGLFTKKDAPSPGRDLEDMQSFKFLLEDGEAHLRNGKLAMALKRFRTIDKIFMDLHDDQFDFHSYCIRRFTLNIYINILHWIDELRWHPIYIRAIVNACKIYIQLHDTPGLAEAQKVVEPPPETEKKSKKQQKKEKIKAAEEARKAAAAAEKEDEETKAVDDDPDGLKAVSVEDPLEQASKLLLPFASENHKFLGIWLASYDVAIRRKKFLQALRALENARSLDASSAELHYRLMDFQIALSASDQQDDTFASKVLKEGLEKLSPGGESPATQNSQYLQANSSNAESIYAVARVLKLLGSPQSEIEDTLLTMAQEGVQLSPKVALEALHFLEEMKSEKVAELQAACQARLPLSRLLLPKQQLALLKERREAAASSVIASNQEEGSADQPANGDTLVIEPSTEGDK